MPRVRNLAITLIAFAACGTPPEIVTAPPPPEPLADAGAGLAADDKGGFENPGGMWLPRQLSEHAETLKKLGLELDPAELADPMAQPLAAVVSLGGCSASFVSPRGLVITNHHCVTGALQYNSTPEQDLLKAGFRAQKPEDEKSIGPTGRIYVTQAFSDVTERVRSGLEAITDDRARYDELEKREKQLVAECEKQKKDVRCELASYYGGAQYLLIEKLEIKDVRLVHAPAAGIGNFGGEVDNWRWPRHTGDFSFYRAYVGKDGKPAEFSADNVPYQPRHFLELPSRPLAAGDLVFVAGYPGRTYRLTTADEVEEVVDWYYPRRLKLFEEYLAAVRAAGKGDREVELKATPLERGLSNAQTYTQGSLEGLTKGGAAAARRKRDTALARWIGADPKRKARYAKVFPKLEQIFAQRKQTRDVDAAFEEVARFASLLNAAITIVRMAEERPKPDAERDPSFQERNWQRLEQEQKALDKRYARKLDSSLAKLALSRAARLTDAEAVEPLFAAFGVKQAADIDATVNRLYAGTRLESSAVRLKLLQTATTAQLRASKDPMLRAALAFWPRLQEKEHREEARAGALALIRPEYVAALREMSASPLAPDANSTLRVTYGTVRAYRPAPEAPMHTPFTVLSGVVAKHTGKEPFDAPAKLLELGKAKRFGPYVDEKLDDVPVDFLADLDITGGNSGSPTLNARGELVGLAFDGNYEAMASDYVFMPEITRSIHVDIRYALWVLDAVDQMDWLLEEMGVTPKIQ